MEVLRIKSLASIFDYENFQFDIKYGISSQCYIQLLQAVDPYFNAVVLEEVAKMASCTESINKSSSKAPQSMQDKHFMRKHGPNAYYGQTNE